MCQGLLALGAKPYENFEEFQSKVDALIRGNQSQIWVRAFTCSEAMYAVAEFLHTGGPPRLFANLPVDDRESIKLLVKSNDLRP